MKILTNILLVILLSAACVAQLNVPPPPTTGTTGQTSVTGGKVGITSPFNAPGGVTYPYFSNEDVKVDGVVNQTLTQAGLAAQCFGATQNGCMIFTDHQERYDNWPFSLAENTQITFGHGSPGGTGSGYYEFTKPMIISNDVILGTGVNLNTDGSEGPVLHACGGVSSTLCATKYFLTPLPRFAAPSATPSGTGGSLTNGTYQIAYWGFVNPASSWDTQLTSALSSFPANTIVVNGALYSDGTLNCGGLPCTQVVVEAGTTGGSAPSWSLQYNSTVSNTAVFMNVGNVASTTGIPAPGRMGIEASVTVSGGSGTSGSIAIPAPPTPAYSACALSTFYNIGDYVTHGGHTYRAIVAGTTASSGGCSQTTSAHSVTIDGGVYWLESGNTTTNFLPLYGWLPQRTNVGGAAGTELAADTANDGTCTSTVNLGNLTLCAPTASYTLTAISATSPSVLHYPPPLVDGTNWLAYLGQETNTGAGGQPYNQADLISGLRLDANDQAAGCIYDFAGQEGSGPYMVSCTNPTEAFAAFIGPMGQNSRVSNFFNSTQTGSTHGIRVGGIVSDSRAGGALGWLDNITVTALQLAPIVSGQGTGSMPYGIGFYGLGITTLAGRIHVEAATDGVYCTGYSSTNVPRLAMGAIDVNAANVTNTVHYGTNCNPLLASVALATQAGTYAIKDDFDGINIATTTGFPFSRIAMTGDCTATNAGVITCTKTSGTAFGNLATATQASNPQSGTYQLTTADFANSKFIPITSGTFTIETPASVPSPGCVQIFNLGSGTISINPNGANYNNSSSTVALLGAAAGQGTPVSAQLCSDGTNYWGPVSGSNARTLLQLTWAIPGALGATTPAAVSFTTVPKANGVATAGIGVPATYFQSLNTAQAANYNSGSAKTLITPTAASEYQVCYYEAITQAATSSSTAPSGTLGYTDASGIARTLTLFASSAANTTSTVVGQGCTVIYTNGSTAVTFTSASYASSGATSMQYDLALSLHQF